MTVRGVVVLDDLRELDIRPHDLFESYIELLRQDVAKFFSDRSQLVEISCPACRELSREVAFERLGLRYMECPRCFTVYLSPRPTLGALEDYYLRGESMRFWERVMMKETDRERREHVFRRRLDWLTDVTDEFIRRPRMLIDCKSKYASFLEEVQRTKAFDSVVVADPTAEVREVCERLGMKVVEKADGKLRASAVTAFEVLEREFNPGEFLQDIHALLSPGGLFFLTTRSISGFDLQVLWEKAKNILPPSHMNLFSVEAIKQVLVKQGFEILELSTPGQLDVEIVRNALQEEPDVPLPRFVSYLLRQRDADAHQSLQEFLQRYRLSSHVRVVCRKR